MQRPDAVLFDLDGTIIDSRVPFMTSMNFALEANGQRAREPEELWPHLGPPTRIALRELVGEDEALIEATLASYREHYERTSTETTVVYDGIPELLSRLRGRVRLAVATSKVGSSAIALLEHVGLAEMFDVISGPDASALAEPKAATVAQALTALGGLMGGQALGSPGGGLPAGGSAAGGSAAGGSAAGGSAAGGSAAGGSAAGGSAAGGPAAGGSVGAVRSAVMVGDRLYDVVGAREHGLPTIGVLWGAGGEQELREAGAAEIVAAPAEIPPLLGL